MSSGTDCSGLRRSASGVAHPQHSLREENRYQGLSDWFGHPDAFHCINGVLCEEGQLQSLTIVDGQHCNHWAQLSRYVAGWGIHITDKTMAELMTRGLYRLGFEEEDVLSQLPPLSMHDKMKVRLSLPREFWPKTWLEEEGS